MKVAAEQINNVLLYPNASKGKVQELLEASKYFLHFLEDEPFGITTVQAICFGCIPIVHNSGGQKEIVPYKELRFTDFNQIPEIINKIENMPETEINKIRKNLQKNASSSYDFKNISKEIHFYLQ